VPIHRDIEAETGGRQNAQFHGTRRVVDVGDQ
jgi:hypothetical protein